MTEKIDQISEVPGVQTHLAEELAFAKRLQEITNIIHETTNVNQILFDLAEEITGLFNRDPT